MSEIKKIKDCTWEEVFAFWEENEGTDLNWTQLAKERGYDSWTDWRLNAYAIPFKMPKAVWALIEVENPAEFIKKSYGGPFSSWQKKYYNGARFASFSDLAKSEKLQVNNKVQAIMKNYPLDSIILILELRDGRRIVVEGMHRSSALSIMEEKALDLPKKLTFAIGKLDLDELKGYKINKEE